MYTFKKNCFVEIIKDEVLSLKPRYIYFGSELRVTSALNFEEFKKIENKPIGAYTEFESKPFDLSFYFDINTLNLATVVLGHGLKEKKPKNYSILENVISIQGTLKWQKGQKNCYLKETKFRHLDKTTNTLLSYGKKFLKSTAISLKLEIAKDIFILFNQDNMFCGWQMKNPETYIVQYYYYRQEYDPYVNFKSEKPHPRLKEFYYKTHKLYEQKKIDLIDDIFEDPERKILFKYIKLYYKMNDLKNPCIGIIALKEKLFHYIDFSIENRALFDSYKK